MKPYPFNIITPDNTQPKPDTSLLRKRPVPESRKGNSFQKDARLFAPGKKLVTAMNTAIALGEPLLITGEPGTGKTQAAYYAAWKLGIEPVIHFQVKSDTRAGDMLYHFDMVRYFYDASLGNLEQGSPDRDKQEKDKNSRKGKTSIHKNVIHKNVIHKDVVHMDTIHMDAIHMDAIHKDKYVEERALWRAFREARETMAPRIMLIDEIDKAPRDFPNDLLHELDQMKFTIKETNTEVSVPANLRPIVFITSNSERRLPPPFLRRCIYHHIEFDDDIVAQAVNNRADEFNSMGEDFINLAIQRFLELRDQDLRKKPATGELLVWLRVLALNYETVRDTLKVKKLSELPFLSALIKDHQDAADLERKEK